MRMCLRALYARLEGLLLRAAARETNTGDLVGPEWPQALRAACGCRRGAMGPMAGRDSGLSWRTTKHAVSRTYTYQ